MALLPRGYVAADSTGSRAIVVVSWISTVLATIAVAARLYARRLQRSGYGWDDWVILAALVPLWAHTATVLVSVYLGGVGHSMHDLGPDNQVVLFKSLTVIQFFFATSLGLVKSSIVLLLMRIFFTKKFKLFGRSTSYILIIDLQEN
ncbi:MAG: hypothetical protein Q9174_006459 [Haloplaca sp. 1 TL-2023]